MLRFEDKYELVSKLGEGSFAEVWVAWFRAHPAFEKRVAVKLMHEVRSDQAARFMRSFINEARLGAALQHPCIVNIFDFGMHEGKPYFGMEYIDGITLRRWLTGLRGDPIPLEAAIEIGYQVARALDYAHSWKGPDGRSQPVVHRDLKPENIIIGMTGEVKLLDYGVARWKGNQAYTTAAHGPKGTPQYMSPEQITDPESVGSPSDLFALGIILIEALTARAPFYGITVPVVLRNVVEQHPHELLEEVAQIDKELAYLLRRLVDKDPDRRPSPTSWVRERLLHLRTQFPLRREIGSLALEMLQANDARNAVSVRSFSTGPSIRMTQFGTDFTDGGDETMAELVIIKDV